MKLALAPTVLAIGLGGVAGSGLAWADAQHPATCEGFIGVMIAAARSGDPTGPQAYIDLADSMYRAMNKGAGDHGMAALPLPGDENSEAQRSMVVVAECQKQMSLNYHEAVAGAYVVMRQRAGLSVELPRSR